MLNRLLDVSWELVGFIFACIYMFIVVVYVFIFFVKYIFGIKVNILHFMFEPKKPLQCKNEKNDTQKKKNKK